MKMHCMLDFNEIVLLANNSPRASYMQCLEPGNPFTSHKSEVT